MKNITNAKSKFKLKLWGKWFNFRLYKRKSFLFFFSFFCNSSRWKTAFSRRLITAFDGIPSLVTRLRSVATLN